MLIRKPKLTFLDYRYKINTKKYSYNLKTIKKIFIFYNWITHAKKPQLVFKIKPVLNNLYLSIIFTYYNKTKLIKHYNLSTLQFFKNKSLISSFFLLELLQLIKQILIKLPLKELNLIIELMHNSITTNLIKTVLSYFKTFTNFYLKINPLTPYNGCRLKKLRRKKVVIYYI